MDHAASADDTSDSCRDQCETRTIRGSPDHAQARAHRRGLDRPGPAPAVSCAGVLVRVRQGAYVDAKAWHASDARGRHEMKARAVLKQAKSEAVVSHVSATTVYDISLYDQEFGGRRHHPQGRQGRPRRGGGAAAPRRPARWGPHRTARRTRRVCHPVVSRATRPSSMPNTPSATSASFSIAARPPSRTCGPGTRGCATGRGASRAKSFCAASMASASPWASFGPTSSSGSNGSRSRSVR